MSGVCWSRVENLFVILVFLVFSGPSASDGVALPPVNHIYSRSSTPNVKGARSVGKPLLRGNILLLKEISTCIFIVRKYMDFKV